MNIETIGSSDAVTGLILTAGAAITLIILWKGVRVVPQSELHVVERFGRFLRVLHPGLNLLIPLLDRIRRKISILERQIEEMTVSVITKDNVEIGLRSTVFLRIEHAEKAVYRIDDFDSAVRNSAMGLMRNASGKLELDEVQAGRDVIASEVKEKLAESAKAWGILITRVEIMDVVVDGATKDAQRRQVLAERERRATVMEAKGVREATELRAEGDRRAVELAADAALYRAEKEAKAKRLTADADAYQIQTLAGAQAKEIEAVGKAMAEQGDSSARFEIAKRQVAAIGQLASAQGTRVVILPTKAVEALGAVEALRSMFEKDPAKEQKA